MMNPIVFLEACDPLRTKPTIVDLPPFPYSLLPLSNSKMRFGIFEPVCCLLLSPLGFMSAHMILLIWVCLLVLRCPAGYLGILISPLR